MRKRLSGRAPRVTSVVAAAVIAALAAVLALPLLPASVAVAAAGGPGTTGLLSGRVIVLNPGHGGSERGAVGPAGLEEGIVNLKVATYLRTFLEEQGATVFLTREGDYDLDPTSHFSGTRDRLEKDAFAASKNPDLFLIMHHNANDRDRAKDQIEVYYRSGDFGPSKQAAEYILAGLRKWMGLGGLVGPGVFTILNHARGTAVLIEGTYISNPKMEDWLRDDANLQKEARGYLDGILAFFGAGVPVLDPVQPVAGQKFASGQPALVARVKSLGVGNAGVGDAAAAIVPATVEVRLDHKVIPPRFDAASGLISATPPQPLDNGPHHLVVRVANERGNYAVPVELDFYVDRPPAALALDAYPTIVPGEGASAGATAPTVRVAGRVLDADGNPVLDGTLVYVAVEGGVPDKTVVVTKDGFFAAEFRPAPGAEIGVVSIAAPPAWQELVVQYGGENSMLSGRLLSDLPGAPGAAERLRGATVTLTGGDGKPSFQTKTDWEGRFVLFDIPPGEYTLAAAAAGFSAAPSRVSLGSGGLVEAAVVALEARYGGALFDRKVVLNADHASRSAADLAGRLARALETAGAAVVRPAGASSGLAGPAEVNAARPAFILNVVPGAKWAVYHYPRDKKTVPAAADLAKRLKAKGLTAAESDVAIEPTREKVVTLASAPSVILAVPDGVDAVAAAEVLTAWLAAFFGK